MSKKKKKNALPWLAAMILLAIGLYVVAMLLPSGGDERIQGHVEVTDLRISSKVPARVLSIRVQCGDSVCRGDTLAIMEAPDVQAKLRQALAAGEAALASAQKARKGSREEELQAVYEAW